jgi:hypothetical protein
MKIFALPKTTAWTMLCVLIIILAGAYIARQSWQTAKVESLFTGPTQLCVHKEDLYYPRTYDPAAANPAEPQPEIQAHSLQSIPFHSQTAENEMDWVDGDSRDEIAAAMEKYASQMRQSMAQSRLNYTSAYKERLVSQLQVITPEKGTLYPPNLCAPYVSWKDPQNNVWQISIELDGETHTFITRQTRWRFPKKLWDQIREKAVTQNAGLIIKGIQIDENTGDRIGDIQATEPIPFRVSADPADNYIVYRLVEPPFSTHKTPNVYIRDIRQDDAELFLSARREYCLNCHNFSSKQGNTGKLAFQVRSMVKVRNKLPTYLAIYDIDKQEGFKVRLPFEIQMTTFMAWSPDSNKLAYSANQKVATIKPIIIETQFAAMGASDIAVYDIENNDTYLVPGASDPNILEIYPRWSPDGNRMIFSRSPVGAHPSQILYDLYVLDLNETQNPTPRPIEGACQNGRSNYYARFSPDGKWLSFCQSDGGDLIRSSSELCLLPGTLQGPAHRLECNTENAADSWYSWSANSRWIVFSSKRGSGVYAYLYMTHIDDHGHASPAIPLPIAEEPYSSFNIPEFIHERPNIDEKKLFESLRVEPLPRDIQLRDSDRGSSQS